MNQAAADAKSIFLRALDCQTPDELASFLEAACEGNERLHARVSELLDAHRAAGNFLHGGGTGALEPLAERQGTVIGPYKLLEQIGEGGFGVVFLAEQERPVRRKVALKIIKPGMDTRQVIARFEAERQALAMMDHPNIAKVFDAGATENGRPYFVMELVQGVPITDYCDQCKLTTRERLELFITVCQAVQHAHQKGVIHRDIKPTNVLVSMQDGKATPKIIDFGVAKAIGEQPITERTLTTAFAQMVGTPLYMSPEQAELSPLGVDTRSDIYSLGVLLYELLTGATPFDKERLHAAPYDEMRRIIREEEPPRPSTRVTTLAADLASTIAEHRRTDARRLSHQVRGELDWIAMKALDKDRNRRYESAGSLARDVERYLHDEPVQACPPSIPYRLKKFIRKHKAAAAFIGLLLVSVAGLVVSNVALTRERDAKTTALAKATTETAKAKAVSDLLQAMLSSANPYQAKGKDYTVRELLDQSSAGLENQLADSPDVEVEIRATMGRAYRSLRMSELAQLHLERAVELGRKVYGSHDENLAAILVDYGWNLEYQDRYEEAEPYLREALDIYHKRGVAGGPIFHAMRVYQDLLIAARRLVEAEQVTHEAMAIAKRSGEESSDFASILHQYADMQNLLGHFAKAEELALEAVQMHRRVHGENPDTALALSKLAMALESQKKLEPAQIALSESLAILRRFYADDHAIVRDKIERLKSIAQARGDQATLERLAK